jgi:hypothetical protein
VSKYLTDTLVDLIEPDDFGLKSPVEIARELNKNTGEIELILSLRRRGKKGIDYTIGE